MSNVDVRKEGYLRRLKTQKKRYFVLRTTSSCGRPRLEYYESEKKFRSGGPARRSILLSNCLNIAKKEDAKYKNVFALYTREDVFGLIADDNEDELTSWLQLLWEEQDKSEQLPDNVSEWFVSVKPRGLGTSRKLAGQYNMRLTNQSLVLTRRDTKDVIIELGLVNIRRCGHTDCFFFMEVGRSAITGAGELWIQVEDQIIAQNMHDAIIGGMQRFTSSISATVSPTSRYLSDEKSKEARQRPMSVAVTQENRERCGSMPGSASPRSQRGSSSSGKSGESSPATKKRNKSFPRFLGNRKSRAERCPSPIVSRARSKKSHSLTVAPHFGGPLARAHSSIDFSRDMPTSNISESTNEKYEDMYMNFNPSDSRRTMSESSGSSYDHVTAKDASSPMKLLDVFVTPAVDDDPPDYMNMAPSPQNETGSTILEDYMNMKSKVPSTVRESYVTMHPTVEPRGDDNPTGSYINMTALNLTENTENKTKPETGGTSSEWYITMAGMESEGTVEAAKNKKAKRRSTNPKQLSADVRNDFLQQMKTSNRQNRVPELKLASTPDIKEQVTIKSSPSSTPKAKLKTVKSTPLDGRRDTSEINGAANISPGFDREIQQHSYINFTPGQFLAEAGSPTHQTQNEYMNIDFDKQDSSSAVKQNKSRHDYVNVELRRRDSTPEAREYINFTPGQMLHEREIEEGPSKEMSELRRDILPTSVQASELSNWLMVDFSEAEKVERSLNYVSLDLSHRDTSKGVAKPRIQPIDTKSVGTSTGSSSYVEIDFTKSQGLKQVLQQKKERSESFVENLI